MKTVLLILFAWLAVVFGQIRWAQRARVQDHTEYFSAVMQETVYEIERRGFSNLRLTNVTQNINLQMYKWLVNGTVVYTNGFLVSIQKMDVTGMTQQVGSPNVSGVISHRATVTGTLNLRDAKLGYDVIFTPTDGPVQRYTGDFTHSTITWQFHIIKDLTSKQINVTMTSGTSGGIVRMVYRPANNVTEVLSRNFFPFYNADGVRSWGTYLEPILLDVVRNKIEFPEVCFGHC